MDILAKDITFSLLAKSLEGLSLRQQAVAQNLANINTPGYRRKDVLFEDVLQAALTEPKSGEGVLRTIQSTRFEVVEESALYLRNDRGGVDLDRETAELAKTTLRINAVLNLLGKRISLYKQTMNEGGF